MKITDYVINKDLKLEDKDFDLEKLSSDLRKGYVKETEVESRIENSKKNLIAENKKTVEDLTEKFSAMEKSYNDTVSNLDKTNQELKNEKLKVVMMSHGFKKDQFEEVSKLRNSLYSEEKDDEKAISGIAEKFQRTYFNEEKNSNSTQEGPIRGNEGTKKPEIKVTRNTHVSNLFLKK